MIFRRFLIAMAFIVMAFTASAQDFAVKTNLLQDVTGTANLGIEFGGGSPKWTYDISGSYSPWNR